MLIYIVVIYSFYCYIILQNDFIHSVLKSHLDCVQCFTVSKDIIVSMCTVISPGYVLNHRLPQTQHSIDTSSPLLNNMK